MDDVTKVAEIELATCAENVRVGWGLMLSGQGVSAVTAVGGGYQRRCPRRPEKNGTHSDFFGLGGVSRCPSPSEPSAGGKSATRWSIRLAI